MTHDPMQAEGLASGLMQEKKFLHPHVVRARKDDREETLHWNAVGALAQAPGPPFPHKKQKHRPPCCLPWRVWFIGRDRGAKWPRADLVSGPYIELAFAKSQTAT